MLISNIICFKYSHSYSNKMAIFQVAGLPDFLSAVLPDMGILFISMISMIPLDVSSTVYTIVPSAAIIVQCLNIPHVQLLSLCDPCQSPNWLQSQQFNKLGMFSILSNQTYIFHLIVVIFFLANFSILCTIISFILL